VGALVTLDLPEGAPTLSLPWIITIGPISDEDEWEPIVVGPYERPHALALAEELVADDDLMAVVEPLLPHASVDEIRAEIAAAIAAGEAVDEGDQDDLRPDDEDEYEDARERPAPPTPEEIHAGFARIAARLTGGGLGSTAG
jgi:hypothetical protein